ncbi:MAG: hypothetical protein ACTSX6_04605 [Candidatus Heimdallarchaeaceae archaeon]
MESKLKLFVWSGVLNDYTGGIAFAIAETEQEAREMLLKKEPCLSDDDSFNVNKPEIHENKFCFTLWGGG